MENINKLSDREIAELTLVTQLRILQKVELIWSKMLDDAPHHPKLTQPDFQLWELYEDSHENLKKTIEEIQHIIDN